MTALLGRFLIRDVAPWEAAGVFALTGDEQTTRYMGFRTHKTLDEAAAIIAQWHASQTKFQAVCDAENPADILGVIGFEVQAHRAAMTIMFRRDWKARGAGREFSVPFVQWIFTHPQIWRVSAFCHVDNFPVRRVLERMGAAYEGTLRRFEMFPNVSDRPCDVRLYSIVRGEQRGISSDDLERHEGQLEDRNRE